MTINGSVSSSGNLLPGGASTGGHAHHQQWSHPNRWWPRSGPQWRKQHHRRRHQRPLRHHRQRECQRNGHRQPGLLQHPGGQYRLPTFGTYSGSLTGGASFAAGSRAINIDTSTREPAQLDLHREPLPENLNWSSTSSSDWDVVNSLNCTNTGSRLHRPLLPGGHRHV